MNTETNKMNRVAVQEVMSQESRLCLITFIQIIIIQIKARILLLG